MTTAYTSHLYFFDPAIESKKKPASQKQPALAPKKEKRLFCAACRHPVTHQDERISVAGGHEHRFTNPHGISFHIGCFREAGGCALIGAATAEYTWFAGYVWRVAVCAHCQTHLGWRFQAGGEYFHGLIVNRLVSSVRASE